ncbi:MAG: STAS domain-containing protein [Anaerolineales bacterium]
MTTQPFDAQVRQHDGVAVIDLHGEINADADVALISAYTEAEGHNTPSILLNFGGVEYINSTGIALIVGLLARARKSGRRLLICGLSPHYTEIFQITRLSDFMTIVPDEAAALAQAAQP